VKRASDVSVRALDLAGTALFAAEGASLAIAAGLDVLGVLVIAFSTALVGGLVRDLLIGSVPPRAIADWKYPVTAFTAGALTFVSYAYLPRPSHMAVVVLDAAGLALFAVAGADKALDFRIPAFSAILLGGITAVGGGVVRDVLLNLVPNVLKSDIYATAALLGAAVTVAGRRAKLAPFAVTVAGFLSCFVLRVVAVWQHWNLPALTR